MKRPRLSSLSVAPGNPSGGTPEEPARTYKLVHVDVAPSSNPIICNLPPHEPLTFASYQQYESHHTKTHVNRCIECHRNLPTDHFLSLHIAENHDPITAVKRARGDKIYACFVDGCDKLCSTWQKRKLHLIDKHMFPRNYDFLIVNEGMDGKRSMLRSDASMARGKPKTRTGSGGTMPDHQSSGSTTADIDDDDADADTTRGSDAVDDMESLTDAVRSLRFVPNSVRFGRKGARAGLGKT